MKVLVCLCFCFIALASSQQWGVSDEDDFKQLDANGDGFIELTEINEWNKKFDEVAVVKKDPTVVEELFNEEDGNKDGKVSLDEFSAGRAARKAESWETEKKGMGKLFEDADVDKDGTVTLDALIWTMRNWTAYQPFLDEHLKVDFEHADTDSDRVVTTAEWDVFKTKAHTHHGDAKAATISAGTEAAEAPAEGEGAAEVVAPAEEVVAEAEEVVAPAEGEGAAVEAGAFSQDATNVQVAMMEDSDVINAYGRFRRHLRREKRHVGAVAHAIQSVAAGMNQNSYYYPNNYGNDNYYNNNPGYGNPYNSNYGYYEGYNNYRGGRGGGGGRGHGRGHGR